MSYDQNANHERRMEDRETFVVHSKAFEQQHILDLMKSSQRRQLTMDEYNEKNSAELEALTGNNDAEMLR